MVSPDVSRCCKEPWFLSVKKDTVVKGLPAGAGGAGDTGQSLGQSPGRKWQPLPVYLLGKFHGQRSNPWGCKESTQLSD